ERGRNSPLIATAGRVLRFMTIASICTSQSTAPIAFRGMLFLGVPRHLRTKASLTARNCRRNLTSFFKRLSCMSCAKCRSAVEGEGTLVERMDQAAEETCGCEQVRVHKHSPGVVLDEEELHFVVPHPGGLL